MVDLFAPPPFVGASISPVVPVVRRLLQRVFGVDAPRRMLVRRVPRQNEGDSFSLADRELADSAHVLAAVLDRSAEAESVWTSDGDAAVLDPPYPRHCQAVVEADDELGGHLDLAADALDDPDDVRRLPARGHEVDQPHRACFCLPLGLEDQRLRPVPTAAPPMSPCAGRRSSARAPTCRAARRSTRRSRSAGSTPSRSSRPGRRARPSADRR